MSAAIMTSVCPFSSNSNEIDITNFSTDAKKIIITLNAFVIASGIESFQRYN